MTVTDGPGLDGRRLRFIVSAGRTGTMFLTQALAHRDAGVEASHEPWPARWELVLGNFRNRTGLGAGALRWLFRRVRGSRLEKLPAAAVSIEINPLLCPLTDLLASEIAPLSIVHLVREPLSWARSMLDFRASGWRRSFIQLVPFAIPWPTPRPDGWSSLAPLERALWRWRYCNERIATLESQAASYCLLRYEDLFAANPAIRSRSFARLHAALGLAPRGDDLMPDISLRLNACPGGHSANQTVTREALHSICGPWPARFGYETT